MRILAVLLMVAFVSPLAAAEPKPEANRWESAIAAFEKQDKAAPPPKGKTLFIGSSSIRRWDLDEYYPAEEVLNRGFGGSQIEDSIHFADRIVIPYQPQTIVLYAGDNDIAAKKTPQRVAKDFQTFVDKVHSELPETRIVFIAIKPSERRWALVDSIREANALVKKITEGDERLAYADIFGPMLGEDGMPRDELFAADKLHLSPAGYELWKKVLARHLDLGK